MLGKLLKHEFQATGRLIPFIFAAIGGLLLLTYLSTLFDIVVFTGMASMLLFACCGAAVIVTLIAVISRYAKSMFGAEGYLTNTLPVSKKSLVLSKALVAFIWLTLSFLVVIVATIVFMWFMGVFNDSFQKGFDEFLQLAGIGGTSGLIKLLIFFTAMMLVQLVVFITQVYLAITINHVAPFNKLGPGGAFVNFIVIYIFFQLIDTVLMFFVPLSLKIGGGDISLSTQPMGGSIFAASSDTMPPAIGLGSYLFNIIGIAVMFWLIIWMTKKKIALK